jgi:hypothetical protein
MLELYGKLYAPINAPYLDNCPTIHGVYRKRASGVYLCSRDGTKRAFIQRDGVGPVSVANHPEGTRHMHSTSEADAAWLGAPSSYAAEREGARALIASLEMLPPRCNA